MKNNQISSKLSAAATNHLYLIDAARGIASIVVVLSHWKHFWCTGDQPSDSFERHRQPLYWLLGNCYDHGGGSSVQFFFLLSGFIFFWLYSSGIATGRISGRRFVVSRFARLYPLHALTLVAMAGLQAVYKETHGEYFVYQWNDAYHLLLNILFVQYWGFERGLSFNGPSWSISVELVLYGAFFLLAYVRRLSLVTTALIVMAAVIAPRFIPGSRWVAPFETFFMGGLTYHIWEWYSGRRRVELDVAIIGLAVSTWLPGGLADWITTMWPRDYMVRVCVRFPLTLMALIAAETRWGMWGHRFSWLGDISYGTYLLHVPLQLLCVIVSTRYGLARDNFYSPTALVLFLSLVLGAAVLSCHLFEKPLQEKIKGKWA
jgi:peptidoglycan/LPS O-acetylase OafA/YrhL